MADSYYWSPNIDLSHFYSGSMTPPTMPDYNAIIGAPGSTGIARQLNPAPSQPLPSRSVTSVGINPATGYPDAPTVSGSAGAGLGAGVRAWNSADYAPPVPSLPNQGQINRTADTTRLNSPAYSFDPNSMAFAGGEMRMNPALGAIDIAVPYGGARATGGASSGLGASGRASGSLNFPTSNPVHQLNVDVDDEQGQFYADSMKMPVRSKSGTVYQPKGGAQTPQQRNAAKAEPRSRPGLLDVLTGNTAPRQGGLLSLLAGLGGGNSQQGGGGLSALLGGSPSSFGSAPSQGLAMTVNPGTSTGQTLSSMGFSDGAAVPAATIRNLSARGYI